MGPMRPDFVAALAGKLGTNPGSVDVLLAAPRLESSAVVDLVEADEGDARTARERRYRTEVQSHADREGGVINLGRGVDGRLDISNARCLRAALAAGFAPLGSEVFLFLFLFLVRQPSST